MPLEAGEFHFLLEICSGELEEGNAVRTFGRLTTYDVRVSEAILSVHCNWMDYQLWIHTALVEPFGAHIRSELLVLGETETTAGNNPVTQAQLLMNADGVNLPLLKRAVEQQRKYFQ
ncbi:CST complex subunit TEN1-like [Rhincodon typus]|uniref:CST complex subunit TEN1-like n=1 Tax=Rhincodon typus TaxID=259920 RepID=UPI00202E7002|nr:CST complex subunit TEN1-like [Rhincodon typus]